MMRAGPLRDGEGIVLIGPRGAGKSAVAKILAGLLGWPLLSTDDMIRLRTGMRNDLFLKNHGWDPFRILEEDCVRRACQPGRKIIDTGGGAGLRAGNRLWIRRHRVVFLDVDVDSALKRLGQDEDPHRPPLSRGLGQREDWLKMIRERRALYQEMSDLRLNASESSPEALAKRIASLTLPQCWS